jgi:hypothetical protein
MLEIKQDKKDAAAIRASLQYCFFKYFFKAATKCTLFLEISYVI